jgi:PIN domain nuclease of toxin-antitoxin system
MSAPLLLDTCAAIWIAEGAPLSDAAIAALEAASDARAPVFVSPMTAWEIGILMARGRLKSPLRPASWFRRLLDVPGVRLTDMTPDVLIASSFLPGDLHRDPVDRILAATARELDYVLVTRDSALLDYAAQGHLQGLAC